MKKAIVIFAAVILLTSCSVRQVNDGEIVMILANDSTGVTVTHLLSEKFIELVEEKSEGSIKIQYYPGGQMGSDREILESCQAGDIDFAVQMTSPQVNFVQELCVFDLPYVFNNAEVARNVFDGPFKEIIAEKYDNVQLKLLGYGDQGFRVMTANDPLYSLNDLKGVKIRTIENKYHMAFWKAVGANPTPMTWSEVLIGLQQKTITAQENTYDLILSSKVYELQQYIMNTDQILHILALISSRDKFNSLSEDNQQIILEAADEAIRWSRNLQDERMVTSRQTIIDSGTEFVEVSWELKQEMKEKSAGVYDMARKDVGDELVDALIRAVEEAEEELVAYVHKTD